jgi:hypothetical protein
MAVDVRGVDRAAVVDRLRCAARYRRTAILLEHWARCASNQAVADIVRERAAARRRAADRVRPVLGISN